MGVIKGFIETSFLDWPGRMCAVIFLSGCNFRCPFCHNHALVLNSTTLPSLSLGEIISALAPYRKWLAGICITGGEPTLSPQIADIMKQLKSDGWSTKLDTNGSQPKVLSQLFKQRLVDMVAMDIKAPLVQHKYSSCAGIAADLTAIAQSIELIRASNLPHEFRMTVLPRLHSEADIMQCASFLRPSSLKLQNFNPKTTLNPAFMKEVPFDPADFIDLQRLVA